MSRLKIAICGGGIASLCLAHALKTKRPDFEVKIFEARSSIDDEGAAVGLGSNAQEALRLLSPSLRDALDEAGGVVMDPSVRVMMGTGTHAGEHVGDIRPKVPQVVVHRSSFWKTLRKRIPDDVLVLGKKLACVDLPKQPAGSTKLHFKDGTTYSANVLIGCDGINSIVRNLVLAGDHPAARPIYTNGYNHRVVVPLATAIEAFGKDYCDLRTQHGWVGDGGFLLTDHVDNGESMQVIAGWSDREPWPHDSPFVEWNKERLKSDLAGWGDVGKAMKKIFTDQPKLFAAAGRVHLKTPPYVNGNICLAGDAAQCFPPFQGAGAGQAIEDALILSTVLEACSDRADVPRALRAYDSIRRPRRSDVASSSIWAARLFTGRALDVGLDVRCMADAMTTWGDNIYNYDLARSQQEALELMRQHSQ